ncbi:MAG: hypothetical protein AAF909_11510 [Pseudomonadota bacterium]
MADTVALFIPDLSLAQQTALMMVGCWLHGAQSVWSVRGWRGRNVR